MFKCIECTESAIMLISYGKRAIVFATDNDPTLVVESLLSMTDLTDSLPQFRYADNHDCNPQFNILEPEKFGLQRVTAKRLTTRIEDLLIANSEFCIRLLLIV